MALLQPNVEEIGHPGDSEYDDRVSDEVAKGTPAGLRKALVGLVGEEQVHGRTIDLVRYATDASRYRMVPQVAVTPRTVDEVVALLRFCREQGRHATLRADPLG